MKRGNYLRKYKILDRNSTTPKTEITLLCRLRPFTLLWIDLLAKGTEQSAKFTSRKKNIRRESNYFQYHDKKSRKN